jgi:23S rRNA (cytosine1962-C5)-methyltransferase
LLKTARKGWTMQTNDQWREYALLDAGDGRKLERWGQFVLSRPEPQALWPPLAPALWKDAAADYQRSASGGGQWHYRVALPEEWTVSYRKLRFLVRPTGFKHTGLFPEQAANWDWIGERLAGADGVSLLNLFAYTGAATVAAVAAGAHATHVDAAKGMVAWARHNLAANGLADRPLRLIVDDVGKFTAREIRRGNRYQAVILDPPSYGRGAGGELWKIEDQLYGLLATVESLLADDARFVILNSYTTGLSRLLVENLLELVFRARRGGKVEALELGLPIGQSGLVLPCGVTGRWSV